VIAIKAGHLVVYDVPYVNAKREVKRGTLVSLLDLAGEVTVPPKTHVIMFAGEHPCDKDGRELSKIKHGSARQQICDGLVVDHSFSSKPVGGYKDYYEKVAAYAAIISSPAEAIDPNATARTRRVIVSDDPDSVFNYADTASSRAGITAVSEKLAVPKVAIIGLGGTGSYVLDLLAKTPANELHLFDGDDYLQHNAFRSPGAPSVAELKAIPKKVDYWAARYAPMRKNIIPHAIYINASNVNLLEGMNFVFICVDRGDVKVPIVEKLEALGVAFIDVGMGIDLIEGQLQGILRVTASTPQKREHVRDKKRIGFASGDADGIYSRNIQIADLNALNAALAVVKWKKLCGFYLDLEAEHFAAYTLDGNTIVNEDKVCEDGT